MIEKSVGAQGSNEYNDVLIVQSALNVWGSRSGVGQIEVDGIVGSQTIGAIRHFQQVNRLVTDGRTDPRGPTISLLRSLLPEEAAIFGVTVGQLLSVLDSLTELSLAAPQKVQGEYYPIMSRMSFLRRFRDLAPENRADPPVVLTGFHKGSNVFGITGVEEAATIFSAIMLLMAVVAMLLIMASSPEFRKAVEVRAKELDRLLGGLDLHKTKFFESAVDLVNLVIGEFEDKEDKCRQSPTFTPSPECAAAIGKFVAHIARLVNQTHIITRKLGILLLPLVGPGGRGRIAPGGPEWNIRITELWGLVNALLRDASNLQFTRGDMQDKCNCPDI